MKTIKLMGREIEVVEHFKEIGEVCNYPELFKRWYNRGQFLKAILGNHSYNGEITPIKDIIDELGCDGFYGECLGMIEGDTTICYGIALYDAKAMSEDALDEALLCSWDSFFMEGKNDEIYFVEVNVD